MTSDAEEDGASRSPSPEDSDQDGGDMAQHPEHSGKAAGQVQTSNGQSKSSNAKDPLRPRRKKARRACFACQRAHLTCGDERPCQRCIKRGLQDACHDGVRKKAKYLHDAPNETLMPGMGPTHFQYMTNLHQGQHPPPAQQYAGPLASEVYAQLRVPSSSFPGYHSTASQGQMPPPLTDNMMAPQGFNSHQSSISPPFTSTPNQQASPMQSLAGAMQQNPQPGQNPLQNPFGGALFDPNDPTQYNFDPASFNFGNHYGALEFGMLGQISSGAAATSPSDSTGHLNQSSGASYATPGTLSTGYSDSPANPQSFLSFSQEQGLGDWSNGGGQPNARQTGAPTMYNLSGRTQEFPNVMVKQEAPHAFAIGAGPSALTSPSSSSSPQGVIAGFDESPATAPHYPSRSNSTSRPSTQDRPVPQRPPHGTLSTPNLKAQGLAVRRPRDPSTIYESVKQPYSYTTGFHGLTAFLQKRFSPQKTLRIAKALASIRPSFISCTKTLNREDLIFMEKCFQRTLWEYEDFINACGTPTIVCRRTGEVAAVGKEFSILTGWKKDVLLGKEPNLNVNTGGSSGQPGTGASSRGGYSTPRGPEPKPEALDGSVRQQPVFLAELLDDDSVITFYEDFARLAFGDSRGSVTARGKLLKYRTKDDPSFAAEDEAGLTEDMMARYKRKGPARANGRGSIADEAGMNQLGGVDGKVECSYCWTVKRDMFDIPMLIVMNFLPCI
ncbi:MAG: C6 finger domain [Lasallia pustulata]|uniref:C6 finger domain n=1 Tax=Lasallia pustulata TaxID=136370 RepID=A0A5M8PWE5_9LECA|nr:MAG: C6 finger domain [Lasallia pustulata]